MLASRSHTSCHLGVLPEVLFSPPKCFCRKINDQEFVRGVHLKCCFHTLSYFKTCQNHRLVSIQHQHTLLLLVVLDYYFLNPSWANYVVS